VEGVMAEISLAPAALLAQAAARTGLDDFGDPAFREGLDLLADDIGRLELDPASLGATAAQLGAFLDARLHAVAGWKAHPDALRSRIERPLIIAGLVRSGTTALHQLLSLDPQFQGPEHWLTLAPMPRPPREQWHAVPQYRVVADRMAAYVAAAPEMADDHMMSAEGVEESLFILAQTFASNMYPSMWQVPRYDRWYRGRDDTASYAWLADVLKLIGHGSGARRWLLKNPTDLYSLGEVLQVFPDAMVVQTHRDPVGAIPSIASLIHAARRVYSGAGADPAEVGRREAEFWREALARAEQARARAPGQVFDVEFTAFVSDQMATIGAIYDHFGLSLAAETERAMRDWLAAHPRRPGGGGRYRPEDYGLSEPMLRETFADYRRRRGYEGTDR
jgi:hypothetical protein